MRDSDAPRARALPSTVRVVTPIPSPWHVRRYLMPPVNVYFWHSDVRMAEMDETPFRSRDSRPPSPPHTATRERARLRPRRAEARARPRAMADTSGALLDEELEKALSGKKGKKGN